VGRGRRRGGQMLGRGIAWENKLAAKFGGTECKGRTFRTPLKSQRGDQKRPAQTTNIAWQPGADGERGGGEGEKEELTRRDVAELKCEGVDVWWPHGGVNYY